LASSSVEAVNFALADDDSIAQPESGGSEAEKVRRIDIWYRWGPTAAERAAIAS
jgi:hypothetical protein